MTAVRLTLSDPQMAEAVMIGRRRAYRADQRHYTRNVHTTNLDNETRHIEGACSEKAVAVYTGGEWVKDLNAFRSMPDVMPDIEVRRIFKHHWRLTVYKGDDASRRFVLVYGFAPHFWLLGWTTGTRARQVGSWEDQNNTGVGGWFVAQDDLWPMEELRAANAG